MVRDALTGDVAFVAVLRPDRSVVAEASSPAHAGELAGALSALVRDPELTFFRVGNAFALVEPLAPERGGGGASGFLLRGEEARRLDGEVRRISAFGVGTLVAACAVLGLLAWLLTQRLLMRSITDMSAVAERVSEYDLEARAPRLSNDELGQLAMALNRIGENLATTLSRMSGVSDGVGQVIERIATTGAQVAEGTGTVSARVAETATSMSEMTASLKGIAENVEVLAQSAEESSSSILEMAATNDEVAENIVELAASVEETAAAIEEMTYSIKEVAKNVDALSPPPRRPARP